MTKMTLFQAGILIALAIAGVATQAPGDAEAPMSIAYRN
ncbi:hypothetical protein PRI8871_02682 [Pseudoprimorskyibacter insulae]|uniref:Uncharacterized protein n=1 Tax=Pseudoprimorskyibacter insulae TaxID=1695997 RepID=A0A2R8AYC1_9RHOB|nr:hypothetical protein PRI8871_02682 [Pseudoprimorskyibacter insulae]